MSSTFTGPIPLSFKVRQLYSKLCTHLHAREELGEVAARAAESTPDVQNVGEAARLHARERQHFITEVVLGLCKCEQGGEVITE
jgi:hypothetical protein